MARTRAGRALTDDHRIAQIAIGDTYGELARDLAGLIDFDNLPASREALLVNGHALTAEGYEMSSSAARAYVNEFRLAETGARSGPAITTPMGFRHVAVELNAALERGAALITSGIATPEQARVLAARWVANSVQVNTMYGGRNTVVQSAYRDRDSGRWRRVTDGEPCAFCAMLATRGPVYREETVGFETHEHCGCGGEIVYGNWQPTELEQAWIDAYNDVAEVATLADGKRVAPVYKRGSQRDTILWRMRRYRPDLFSDGIR